MVNSPLESGQQFLRFNQKNVRRLSAKNNWLTIFGHLLVMCWKSVCIFPAPYFVTVGFLVKVNAVFTSLRNLQ